LLARGGLWPRLWVALLCGDALLLLPGKLLLLCAPSGAVSATAEATHAAAAALERTGFGPSHPRPVDFDALRDVRHRAKQRAQRRRGVNARRTSNGCGAARAHARLQPRRERRRLSHGRGARRFGGGRACHVTPLIASIAEAIKGGATFSRARYSAIFTSEFVQLRGGTYEPARGANEAGPLSHASSSDDVVVSRWPPLKPLRRA